MMLGPSSMAFTATASIRTDASPATTTAEMGDNPKSWTTKLANLPCRIVRIDHLGFNLAMVGPSEQPESRVYLAFTTPLAIDLDRDEVVYTDPNQGTRYFKPIGINDVHAQGILFVLGCMEHPRTSP